MALKRFGRARHTLNPKPEASQLTGAPAQNPPLQVSVDPDLGFPKIRCKLFGGPHNKDYCKWGSIWRSLYFGKLPPEMDIYLKRPNEHSKVWGILHCKYTKVLITEGQIVPIPTLLGAQQRELGIGVSECGSPCSKTPGIPTPEKIHDVEKTPNSNGSTLLPP